jgi:hypothetical protein
MFAGDESWLSVNNGVKPAYGDQFIAGTKISALQGYSFHVAGYYRTMENLFERDPFIPDRAGLNYAQLFRIGTGYAYGIEISLEKHIGRLTGFLGYSFSITRRKYPHLNYPIGQPGQARFFPPKFSRPNDLKIVLNYKLSGRWKASAAFKYASGQAYTKPLARTQTTIPIVFNQLVVGKVNASRMPPYSRLDIGFTRKGTFFGLAKAKWKFQIINVYSHRNVWYFYYDLNKNPVEQKAARLLPLLPNVSYTVTFGG